MTEAYNYYFGMGSAEGIYWYGYLGPSVMPCRYNYLVLISDGQKMLSAKDPNIISSRIWSMARITRPC